MKKRVLTVLLLAASIAGSALAPRAVAARIPTAYYIKPSLRAYENIVSCSGVIQSANVRQVFLRAGGTAEEVFVAVGDSVKAGDLLVKLGGEGTAASLIRDASGELGSPSTGADWAALAASYGLSATLDSAALADMAGLASPDARGEGAEGVLAEPGGNGEVTAPIDGVVTEVAIQKGIPAGMGTAIVTVADDRNYRVLASVREEDIARVGLGSAATVRGAGFEGTEYTGTVTKIHPTARRVMSGAVSETVVDVEIRLAGGSGELKPGFTAKVGIEGGSDYDLVTVPYEAIRQDENNDEYLYVYEDGKMLKRVVTTGKELTSEVEVASGINTDSVVVMNPSGAAREGAMIRLRGLAHAA